MADVGKANGPTPSGLASGALQYVRTAVETARNAAEVIRFGGLETGEERSPFTVVSKQLHFRLRRYFPDDTPTVELPILLVPPLMLAAEVWDVSPGSSAVASLNTAGIDTWVVDFGDPGHEPGGLERTLTDHVIAVSEAIDQVRAETGRDVVVAGYSQGGMFCYQVAAYRRGEGIDSLVTFGSPVDARAPLALPISPELAANVVDSLLASGILRHIALPSWASRTAFKLLDPVKTVQGRAKFLLALHDRDALMPRERQRQFLEVDGFTAWSGPAIAELLELFIAHNRMLSGGIVIKDRSVTLADIDVPILTVVGTTDTLGHPDSVRAVRDAAPKADVHELTLNAGHFGLVVGSTANTSTWPSVASWVNWRAGAAELAEDIVPAATVSARTSDPVGRGSTVLEQAAEVGVGAGLVALGTVRTALRSALGLMSEASGQLPRLSRLEHLDPSTPISLGLLLDEQARKSPENVVFLWGDRAYQQHEVKHRVDAVVKGLINVGVRHGDRVGVLMTTRPSAFSVVAALSRLGATAVLLRPDGDLGHEVELGRVTRVISDPEHIQDVDRVDAAVAWCVLGGGAEFREMDPRIVDMERIDPDDVHLPAWYQANPHRAGDLALVMFTGIGARTSPVQITNHRWALSALGTAAAAALKPGDTVYSTTPIHHTSAMLMSLGGAVASGSRFAMASSDDAETFWDEVRRYGATHVSYTWTSLRSVVNGPVRPAEAHHPIRMFMGSGMPAHLWGKVLDRFPSARVLEFYAAADGDAILANVSGVRVGSMGRPLPGTAEVRIAAFDQPTRSLHVGPDGLGRECDPGEVGLLVAKVHSVDAATAMVLRGVFEPGDAWRSTGDLFYCDAHQDFWLVDSVAALVDTPRGVVAPGVARDALAALDAVDVCIAFGVEDEGVGAVVCAATLLPGTSIDTSDVDQAMGRLPENQRPAYVQVVPKIDLSTWHRPMSAKLKTAGVPKPTRTRAVWQLDADTGTYEQLP